MSGEGGDDEGAGWALLMCCWFSSIISLPISLDVLGHANSFVDSNEMLH